MKSGKPSTFVLHCAALTMAEHLAEEQGATITWTEGEHPAVFLAKMGELSIVVRVEDA